MMPDKLDNESDLAVHAEEYLEIISTEDERIKIIGEELANDTGRAIFSKVSQGITSSNELAKSLNISLPLVTWHVNRLLSVGLIKIERIEMSSKNKQMKYYGPVKTALVIIPPERSSEIGPPTKKETVLMKLRHYMASISAAIIGATGIYLVAENQNQQYSPENAPAVSPQTTASIPEATKAPLMATPVTPPAEPSFLSGDPMIILIAILSGVAIFAAVFFGIRFAIKSKNKKLHKEKKFPSAEKK